MIQTGTSIEDAKLQSNLLNGAKEMLRKWEAGDKEIVSLWKKMKCGGFMMVLEKLTLK